MKQKEPAEDTNQWLEFLNLGWMMAGTMTLPLGMGIYMDRYFQTKPVFILIGTFMGFIGCGYTLYRVIEKSNTPKK